MVNFYKLLLLILPILSIFNHHGMAAPGVSQVENLNGYFEVRKKIMQAEDEQLLGSKTPLETDDEKEVNKILMTFKRKEYEEGLFQGGKYFGASTHFFHTKPLIEASNVFKIIRVLPKGAALHIHETSAGDAGFIARNLTLSDDLYYCTERDLFQFFDKPPSNGKCGKNPDTVWTRVADLRRDASSDEFIEKWLFEKFSLVTSTPHSTYPDINTVWSIFEAKVKSTSGIVKNIETREAYLTATLQEFYDDNVMYVEFRSGLTSMYRKNGSRLSPSEATKLTLETVNKFKASHPNFWGAKYIVTTHRFQTAEELEEPLDRAISLVGQFPGFIVGFDLVGQEERGNPLKLYASQLRAKVGQLKYYFHAGETDWKGSKIDDNLLDAILLNTSRFGHGYSLPGRPQLMEIVKERQTAVEICPISNQVLGLVEDFRNHPASQLLRNGFPVVISSDDPGVWGASGLSYDWYITFMAMANERDDLRFLKQLAINSIQLSAMNKTEKEAALKSWGYDWNLAMKQINGWSKAKIRKDLPFVSRI